MVETCQSLGSGGPYMQMPPPSGGSGNAQRYGCKMQTLSDFVGNSYNTVKLWLKKESGIPNTAFNVSIYRDGTLLPIHTFHTGQTDDLTDAYVYYEYTNATPYTIVADDILAVNWESESYKLYTYGYNTPVANLPQMRYNQWDDPNRVTWSTFTESSFTYCLASGAPSPSGGTLLPPPIAMVRL